MDKVKEVVRRNPVHGAKPCQSGTVFLPIALANSLSVIVIDVRHLLYVQRNATVERIQNSTFRFRVKRQIIIKQPNAIRIV